MKRSEFRKVIKECLCELLVEGSFDHMVKPGENGRHPQHQHLVYYEFEPHHGSYIVTAPHTEAGDMLMSAEEVVHGFGQEALDNEFAYGADDYLEYLESGNPADDVQDLAEGFDKHLLSREVGKYLTKKLGNKQSNWPAFEDFQSVLNSRRALKVLGKFPLDVAAVKAGEMILATSHGHLNESVIKAILETTEYPEDPWVRVGGYIEGYCAVSNKEDLYEDGLKDAISEEIDKLQDSEILNIDVNEVRNKRGIILFKIIVEFLFDAHPTSEILGEVSEVAENIPHILSNPKPKIDATTDLGGFDRPTQ